MIPLDKEILEYEGLKINKIGDLYYLSLSKDDFYNVHGFIEKILVPNGLDIEYSEDLNTLRIISSLNPDEVVKKKMKKMFKNFPKKCNGCGKFEKSKKFKVCAKCRTTKYCSKECQVKDWRLNHKEICQILAKTKTKNPVSSRCT